MLLLETSPPSTHLSDAERATVLKTSPPPKCYINYCTNLTTHLLLPRSPVLLNSFLLSLLSRFTTTISVIPAYTKRKLFWSPRYARPASLRESKQSRTRRSHLICRTLLSKSPKVPNQLLKLPDPTAETAEVSPPPKLPDPVTEDPLSKLLIEVTK